MGVLVQMVGAVALVVVAVFLLATLFPLLVVWGLASAIYRAIRDDLGL